MILPKTKINPGIQIENGTQGGKKSIPGLLLTYPKFKKPGTATQFFLRFFFKLGMALRAPGGSIFQSVLELSGRGLLVNKVSVTVC